MAQVIIGIGTNVATKAAEMEQATQWLAQLLPNCRISEPYANPATPQSLTPMPYLNAVAIGQTHLEAVEFQTLLKDYEAQRGRTPTTDASQGVIIDLDMVVYDGRVLRPSQYRQPYFQLPLASLSL